MVVINEIVYTNIEAIKLVENLISKHTGVTIFENPYNRNVLRIGYDGLDAYAYVLEDTEEVEGNLKDFAEKHNINWKVGRFW